MYVTPKCRIGFVSSSICLFVPAITWAHLIVVVMVLPISFSAWRCFIMKVIFATACSPASHRSPNPLYFSASNVTA